MSWLSKATGFVSKVLGYTPFTGFGMLNSATGIGSKGPLSGLLNKAASAVKITTPGQSIENKAASAIEQNAIAAARKAAHDAEVDQLAQNSLGAIALRKRRGGYATMLTGSPMMGSSPGSSGKTLLSQ